MKTFRKYYFAVFLSFVITNVESVENLSGLNSQKISDDDKNQNSSNTENQLATRIYAIIEHFKQDDPVGLPLLPLPDPTDVPEIQQSISGTKLVMTKVKLSGISQFRIQYVTIEANSNVARCGIIFDTLKLQGDYTLHAFISRSKGPFTIFLKDVVVEGNATLGVEVDGHLRTQDINIDVRFAGMKMDFKNLGFAASIFQSIANSASNVIFDGVKPLLLKDAYKKIKAAVDENIDTFLGDVQIPNSISPIDNAIAEARKQVREKGYDPFQVDDYNYPGVFGGKIFNTWLYGISSFYRLGDLSLNIKNNNAIITIEVGTQEIAGTTNWQLSIAKGMITRGGQLQFSIQHIKVLFVVIQPLNLSKKLKIDDLQLDLGNIQIRSSGLGTVDYAVEFIVNLLPNLLRYQIMDALEKPLMRKLQEFADKVDVEMLLKEKLNEYHTTGSVGLRVEL